MKSCLSAQFPAPGRLSPCSHFRQRHRPCILSPDPCSAGSRPVPPEATWQPGPTGSAHAAPGGSHKYRSTRCLLWKVGGRDLCPHAVLSFGAALAPLPSKGQELRKETGSSVVLGLSTQQKTNENPRSDSCCMPKQRTPTEMLVVGGGPKDEGVWG